MTSSALRNERELQVTITTSRDHVWRAECSCHYTRINPETEAVMTQINTRIEGLDRPGGRILKRLVACIENGLSNERI